MQHNVEVIFARKKKKLTEKRVRALKCRTLLPCCLWVRLWFGTIYRSLIVKALHAKSHWNSSTPRTPDRSDHATVAGTTTSFPLTSATVTCSRSAMAFSTVGSNTAKHRNCKRTSFREEWKSTDINLFTFQGAVAKHGRFLESFRATYPRSEK